MTKKEISDYLVSKGCSVSADDDGDLWVGFKGILEQVPLTRGLFCFNKEPQNGTSYKCIFDIEPEDLKTIVDFYGGK